jgi:hypothetical protein
MHRNRTWTLDPPEWRTQRNRLLPIEGGDGSTLNLDFTKGVLDPRITFSRLSTATFVNSQGYVEYAGVNLISNSGLSVTAGPAPTSWTGTGNYDGTSVAGVTTIATGVTAQSKYIQTTISASPGITYSVSILISAVSGQHNTNTMTPTGTAVVSQYYLNGTPVGKFDTAIPGLLTAVFTTSSGTTNDIRIGIGATGSAVANANLIFSLPRCVPGNFPQPVYLASPTDKAYHAPRFDYDPTDIGEPKGLLIEGIATNYVKFSDAPGTAGAGGWSPGGTTTITLGGGATAPDGITASTRLQFPPIISATISRIYQETSYPVATYPYTMSVWMKSNTANNQTINILGSANTNNIVTPTWQRFVVTVTASASLYRYFYISNESSTVATDISIWGAQLEAGLDASSYIPTGASTVQRVGDDCFMSGTNFSSWWNQSEGTAFIETAGMTKPTDLTYRAFTITQNLAVPYQIGATFIYDNSGFRITELASSATKHAVALKANDFAISNGTSTIRTGTGAFSNTYNRLQLGAYENQSAYMNGCIKKFKYYPTRLPNAQLQQLTQPDYVAPTLNLNFLSMSSNTDLINSGLTFGRLSNATFVNAQGYVQYADANEIKNSTMLTASNFTQTMTGGSPSATINGNNTVTLASVVGVATWLQGISIVQGLPSSFSIEVTALNNTDIRVSDMFASAFGFTGQTYYHTNTSGVTSPINSLAVVSAVGLYTVTATTTGTYGNLIFGTGCNGFSKTGSITFARPQFQYGTVVPRTTYVPNTSTGFSKYDSPRFDNKVLTSRTNLILQSNSFTVTPTWAQKDGTHSVTLTADTAPPGFSGTATKITALNTNAGITQPLSVPVISGKTAIISFYAKSNAVTAHTCFLQQASSLLAAVTIPTTWTRIDQTAGANAITEITLKGFIDPLDISIYGMQVEYVTSGNATAYIPTTTTQVTVNTTEPKGLLIEGLTENVCTYSQEIASANWNTTTGYTVTTNTTDLLSPAGDNKATKLVYTSGYARCIQTVTLAANSTYTMSYWVKSPMAFSFRVYDLTAAADIASSIGSIPSTTEWTRVQKTFTTGASTSSCWFYIANDGGLTAGLSAYVWGAQIELGTGASSYIPTGASKVIRTGDSGVMSNITNLKYSTQKGSIYWRGVFNKQPLSYTTLIGFQTATDQPTFETFGNALSYFTAARGAALTAGGGNEVSRTFTLNSTVRYASSVNTLVDPIVSVNLNGTAGSVNKGGNGNMYLATRFVIGRQPLTTTHEANYPSVTLEQIQYYPTTLLPHQLQALTS